MKFVPGRNSGVGGPNGAMNPSGGDPASATIKLPSLANTIPRGLISPDATTFAFGGKGGCANTVIGPTVAARRPAIDRSAAMIRLIEKTS